MRFLFKQQPKFSLGISISNTLLSIIQLRQSASGLILENFAVKELSKNNIYDNKILDTESMGQIISELISSLDLKITPAVTNLSQGEVLTKIIQMPLGLSDSEIEAQIRIDADLYIPYPLAEVSFDFEILGESVSDSELEDVLLVIAQTDSVDLRVDSLAFANVESQVVEVDIHAVERAYQFIAMHSHLGSSTSFSSHSKTAASKTAFSVPTTSTSPNIKSNLISNESDLSSILVDIGNSRTTIYLLKNGEFVYQSQKLFGTGFLADSIQAFYDFDDSNAKQAVIDWGTDNSNTPVDYMQQCVEPFIRSLIDYVQQSWLDFEGDAYDDKKQDDNPLDRDPIQKLTPNTDETESLDVSFNISNSVRHIMLCGGGACLTDIKDLIEAKMGIQVILANPFKYMVINPQLDDEQLFKIAPRLMTTFGLSSREYSSNQTRHKQKI